MYPLTDEQRKKHAQLEQADRQELSEQLTLLSKTCSEICHQIAATCATHSADVRKIYRNTYLSSLPDHWYSDLVTYNKEMAKLFDSPVEIMTIHRYYKRALRLHEKASYCTPRDDDDVALIHAKAEAAKQFDDPRIKTGAIVEGLQHAAARFRATRSAEEIALGERLASVPAVPATGTVPAAAAAAAAERYRVHGELFAAHPGELASLAEARARWHGMVAAGAPLAEIRAAIARDADERDADIARVERQAQHLSREADNLKLAKAGHRKKLEKKRERAEAEASRLLDLNTETCGGAECAGPARPLDKALGPLECRGCLVAVVAGLPGARHTYWCSEDCQDRSEIAHYSEKHPCSAGEHCVGEANAYRFAGFGYCKDCWTFFRIASFWCGNACRTKNASYHDKEVHEPQREIMSQKMLNDPMFEKSLTTTVAPVQ